MKSESIRQWFLEKREKKYPCAYCGEKVFSYWQVFFTQSAHIGLKCPICRKRTKIVFWMDALATALTILPMIFFFEAYFAPSGMHPYFLLFGQFWIHFGLTYSFRFLLFSHIQFFKKD